MPVTDVSEPNEQIYQNIRLKYVIRTNEMHTFLKVLLHCLL
jgi:uncharacterized UPF0146 family protein